VRLLAQDGDDAAVAERMDVVTSLLGEGGAVDAHHRTYAEEGTKAAAAQPSILHSFLVTQHLSGIAATLGTFICVFFLLFFVSFFMFGVAFISCDATS
jgi:hypothetical protein